LPYETGLEYRQEVTFDGIHLKMISRSQETGEERHRTLVWTRATDSTLIAAPSAAPPASAQGTSPTAGSAVPIVHTESAPTASGPGSGPLTPTREVATKYGDMPTDYEEAIRRYFQEHLRYPDSVQYQGITKPEHGYTTAVTGAFLMREKREYGWTVKVTINAKNSHDSYTGLKTYTFLFRGEKIVDARLPLPGDEMN